MTVSFIVYILYILFIYLIYIFQQIPNLSKDLTGRLIARLINDEAESQIKLKITRATEFYLLPCKL